MADGKFIEHWRINRSGDAPGSTQSERFLRPGHPHCGRFPYRSWCPLRNGSRPGVAADPRGIRVVGVSGPSPQQLDNAPNSCAHAMGSKLVRPPDFLRVLGHLQKKLAPSKDVHITSAPSPGSCANLILTTTTKLIDAEPPSSLNELRMRATGACFSVDACAAPLLDSIKGSHEAAIQR